LTKYQFLELYGSSIYETRLRAALSLLARYQPFDALQLADEFLDLLLKEELERQ